MRVVKGVIQIGDSLGVIINKLVLEEMSVVKGDAVVVDVVKKVRRKKDV